VDYTTRQRYIKDSGYFVAEVAARHAGRE
jgi:hypothetical protein